MYPQLFFVELIVVLGRHRVTRSVTRPDSAICVQGESLVAQAMIYQRTDLTL
tara:strand:- start:240 stop:395 length:156 start_codon:yes stop_codon:yes gene_type:complete